jgi:hypothetical protein
MQQSRPAGHAEFSRMAPARARVTERSRAPEPACLAYGQVLRLLALVWTQLIHTFSNSRATVAQQKVRAALTAAHFSARSNKGSADCAA